jgi:hypothetical protein
LCAIAARDLGPRGVVAAKAHARRRAERLLVFRAGVHAGDADRFGGRHAELADHARQLAASEMTRGRHQRRRFST